MRIGYLIPEFPAQTHTFIWREMKELERLGAEVAIVSTRRPHELAPHDWVPEALARTVSREIAEWRAVVKHAKIEGE